mmetsp:Transcript_43582/g.57729  ORF Transcript_43582/g.57729 Transcript_43582/m.57729 type:complete len:138 (+) Transcript_43582:977-1390(+)
MDQATDYNSIVNSQMMDFTRHDMEPNSEFDPSDAGSMNSGIDSDGGRVRQKTKKGDKSIGGYNMLKILNNLLYLITLCFAIGYFASTKYTSKFVYYAFGSLLVGRPALIMLYSLIMLCLEWRRSKPKKNKGGSNKHK